MSIDDALILANCKKAAKRSDWPQVLELVRDNDLLAREPAVLAIAIRAARELDDQDAVLKLGLSAIQGVWAAERRYALARELLMANRTDIAWRLLQADQTIKRDPAFAWHARRLMSYATDKQLKSEIKAAVLAATRGGSALRPSHTEIAFPNPGAGMVALGAASASASTTVARRHLKGLRQELRRFSRTVETGRLPAVREYRQVFVDHRGQIWRGDGTILKTTGHPLPSIADAPRIDFGFAAVREGRGIYHWLVDQVPCFAWMMQRDAPRPTILLREGGPAFERETLALAGLDDREVYGVADPVFVDRLLIGSVGFRSVRYWNSISPIFRQMLDGARKVVNEGAIAGDRLYISRRDAKRRPMLNEKLLEREMAARGFTVVAMGELPLGAQILAASKAKIIVGPHGAGLAHLMMSPQGCRVIELLPIADGTYRLRFNYARLCIVLGHCYDAWLEPQTSLDGEWKADIKKFLRFLDRCIGT